MASELVLVLCDFFPRDDAAQADHALPRLPALEQLLAASRVEALPEGWRASIGARFGGLKLAALAPAATAALAWLDPPAPAGLQYWFATPVHYFAGLDSVRLHPAGLLQLTDAVQATLVSDFSRVFGDSSWQLHAIGRRELLLAGVASAASGADPARFVGCDPGEGLPQGPGAATLRRLGVEVEMWLHEHPVNQQRRASGELPVSALWFWGSTAPRARANAARGAIDAPPTTRLYGEEIYAEALWRLRGGPIELLPESLHSTMQTRVPARLVLFPALASDGLDGALQRLERHWLAPALAALQVRALSSIELLTGSRAYRLRRLHLARFWRARPPWWESLA